MSLDYPELRLNYPLENLPEDYQIIAWNKNKVETGSFNSNIFLLVPDIDVKSTNCYEYVFSFNKLLLPKRFFIIPIADTIEVHIEGDNTKIVETINNFLLNTRGARRIYWKLEGAGFRLIKDKEYKL